MQTARESHGTGCSTKRGCTHSAQRELAMIAIRDRHRPSFNFLILRGHQWVIHHTVGQHSKSKDRYRRGNRGRYGVGGSQILRDGDWKCRHKKKNTEHMTRGNISGHKVVGYNGNNDSLDQYTKRKAVAQRVTGRGQLTAFTLGVGLHSAFRVDTGGRNGSHSSQTTSADTTHFLNQHPPMDVATKKKDSGARRVPLAANRGHKVRGRQFGYKGDAHSDSLPAEDRGSRRRE